MECLHERERASERVRLRRGQPKWRSNQVPDVLLKPPPTGISSHSADTCTYSLGGGGSADNGDGLSGNRDTDSNGCNR